MPEVLKYNPVNFTPEHLFRPPTSVVGSEVGYLIGQLTECLEGNSRTKERNLLVGTEFEIIFFDPNSDPTVDRFKYKNRNPNYSADHAQKLKDMRKFGADLRKENKSEYLQPGRFGKLVIEYRTAPQQVPEHLETIERFGDLMRQKCTELGVMPVVFSQHIHLSLRDNPESPSSNSNKITNGYVPNRLDIRNAFTRTNPLVLLPEEWGAREDHPSNIKHDGRDNFGKNTLEHPEFRRLSSEYANDPRLNLLLSLRAMYSSCLSRFASTRRDMSYTYSEAVEDMGKDRELAAFFGESTLSTLTRIVGQYPEVSRREKTIDQVK